MKKSLGMVVDVRVWMSEFLRGGVNLYAYLKLFLVCFADLCIFALVKITECFTNFFACRRWRSFLYVCYRLGTA